tara:strand:+ start:113 stop:301 length:189 start_codon:yes stop_codon:yes gene_type:complete
MNKNNLITAAAVLFFLVGAAHLIRIFYGWKVTINQCEIPMWTSFIGTAIPLYLAKSLLKIRK